MRIERRTPGSKIRIGTGIARCGHYGFAVDEADRIVALIPADQDHLALKNVAMRFLGGEELERFATNAYAITNALDAPHEPNDLTIAFEGSEPEMAVWTELTLIPPGMTASYGEIARRASARLGAPINAQEAGAACAGNRIAILEPCHRVIRGDGKISGYRWGVERKKALLTREAEGFNSARGRIRAQEKREREAGKR